MHYIYAVREAYGAWTIIQRHPITPPAGRGVTSGPVRTGGVSPQEES